MHELLLHASLPASRQNQLLSILAGLASVQPIPLHEQVHLYKPNRLPETNKSVQVGAVQGVNVPKAQSQMQSALAGDLFYLRVVQELKDDDEGTLDRKGDRVRMENDGVKMEMDDDGGADGMDVDIKPSMGVSSWRRRHLWNVQLIRYFTGNYKIICSPQPAAGSGPPPSTHSPIPRRTRSRPPKRPFRHRTLHVRHAHNLRLSLRLHESPQLLSSLHLLHRRPPPKLQQHLAAPLPRPYPRRFHTAIFR